MAKEVKKITVEKKSAYGVFAGNAWYNIGKFAKGPDGNKLAVDYFQIGQTYDVIAEGKKEGNGFYLNGLVNSATNSSPSLVDRVTPKEFDKDTRQGLTKAEWADKDLRISHAGLLQAAAETVAHFSPTFDADKISRDALVLAKALKARRKEWDAEDPNI